MAIKKAKKPAPKPKPKTKTLLQVAKAAFNDNVDTAVYAATLGVLEALHARAARKPEVREFLEAAIAEVKKGGGQDGGDGPSQGPGEKVGGGD